jgi:hypothetical protein
VTKKSADAEMAATTASMRSIMDRLFILIYGEGWLNYLK